jgi:hypothetical protein
MKRAAVLTDHFAAREDDAAGRLDAAPSVGTDLALPAAEPGGIVGGHSAPAPAAAGPGPLGGPEADEQDPIQSGGVSPRAQDRLVELGLGEAAMGRFVADYLQLLDGRLDTIRRCLVDSDVEGARVAVLSLESSSRMLDAGPLAERLGELRSHLDLGPTPQRNALMSLVEVAAAAFRRDLQARDLG